MKRSYLFLHSFSDSFSFILFWLTMAPVQASLSYGTVHVFGSYLSFIWTFTRLVTLRFRCCHSRWSTMTLFVAKNFIFFFDIRFHGWVYGNSGGS